MRIVTWNANMALRKKIDALTSIQPDLAIVPECEESLPVPAGASFTWVGRNRNKGLGVLGFGGYEVDLHPTFDPRIQWIAPVSVRGESDFLVLAVWSHYDRATEFHPLEPKTAQPQQALVVYRHLFEDLPLVMAGDFNSNVQWDKPGRQSNWAVTTEKLHAVGLVSAYHDLADVPFGAEPDPTLYWRDRTIDGPTYHIDFCFVPRTWTIDDVAVGSFAEWVGNGLSDHVPITVDVTPSR